MKTSWIEETLVKSKSKVEELDGMLIKLLLSQLKTFCLNGSDAFSIDEVVFNSPLYYRQWLEESVRILKQKGLVSRQGSSVKILNIDKLQPKDDWESWAAFSEAWNSDDNSRAQIKLLEVTVKNLVLILRGEISAMEVMFPNSSMKLVEGIYKDNKIADFYNQILTDEIVKCIEAFLKQGGETKIRILEIGAGTGGTTEPVLKGILKYQKFIQEYRYTDISKAFLVHAEREYGPLASFLKYGIYDVSKDARSQDLEIGSYDIVLATNVLHATKNIDNTLKNAKSLLRRYGVLLINEMSYHSLFAHMTFGLLEGWWFFEDAHRRMPGGPGLSAQSWSSALRSAGFLNIYFPGNRYHDLGQQIIVTESDGVIYTEMSTSQNSSKELVNKEMVDDTKDLKRTSMSTIDSSELALQDAEYDIKDFVKEKLAEALGMRSSEIRNNRNFSEYGVDSLIAVNLINLLNKEYKLSLQTTVLFDYSSIDLLSEHLLHSYEAEILKSKKLENDQKESIGRADIIVKKTKIEMSSPHTAEKLSEQKVKNISGGSINKCPVAIIGMSGKFAKSEDLDQLWEHLSSGVNLVEEVDRWNLKDYEQEGDVNERYCNYGSFIDNIDQFDPFFFNISGLEATYMDPQQRLFLEESWKALEDAGYAGDIMQNKLCGVYVGCSGGDYLQLLENAPPPSAFWGNADSVIPARISYFLNLQGPAISIDTACSSSLVAIHTACQGLWTGDLDMALSGGVFLQSTPGFYLSANRAGMLSPTGKCHTFDGEADGFVPGEGVGVVVLKRLEDALRDRDNIHGVIRASGINQDGRTNGITAPSAKSQHRLESELYEKFKIDANQIDFVEAHGTGTRLGDPIEFEALSNTFRKQTDAKNYCALGSIKTNIGHAAAAAGIAGVLKILLSLKNEAIPPSLHFKKANPSIQLESSPFYVNSDLVDWKKKEGRRRYAAVSSFGFSGTNAHMVFEDFESYSDSSAKLQAYLIPLSACSSEQLKEQVSSLITFLKNENHNTSLSDISYTLMQGRKHFDYRFCCVCQNIEELVDSLNLWMNGGETDKVFVDTVTEVRETLALKHYGNDSIEKSRSDLSPNEYLDILLVVAGLYVQGYKLNYNRIFSEGVFGRISLPTYPFAKESYWVESKELGVKSNSLKSTAILHDLVHENTSNLNGLRFSSKFKDSKNSTPVNRNQLPFAFLEMLRVASSIVTALSGPDLSDILFTELEWKSNLSRVGSEYSIDIDIWPVDEDEFSYELDLRNGFAEKGTIVYQGNFLIDKSYSSRNVDIQRVIKRCAKGYLSANTYYVQRKQEASSSLNDYQLIKEIYEGDHELLLRLKFKKGIKDCLFLSQILSEITEASLTLLKGWTEKSIRPKSIKSLRYFTEYPTFSWVTISMNRGCFDINIFDDRGVEEVRIESLQLDYLDEKESSLHQSLNSNNGSKKFDAAPSILGDLNDIYVHSKDELNDLLSDIKPIQSELKDVLASSLMCQIVEAGLLESSPNKSHLLSSVPKHLNVKWLSETLNILEKSGLVVVDNDRYRKAKAFDSTMEKWNNFKSKWNGNQDAHAQIQLLNASLLSLKDILSGSITPTEVLFPEGSMRLVEAIYKDNRLSDYFNFRIIDVLKQYVKKRIELDQECTLKILEIGAGTGGTSLGAFEMLRQYHNHIVEYAYTDISASFIQHGEEKFKRDNPFFKGVVLNIERPLKDQGISESSYDIVIAANVLHATKNIQNTLKNVKSALRPNGVVLMNEVSSMTLFSHLTFGLLEGWWKYDDSDIRIPGCPGLSPESWHDSLEKLGFKNIQFPAAEAHELGAQIIVAESDGEQVVLQNKFMDLEVSRISTNDFEIEGEVGISRNSTGDKSIANLKVKIKNTVKDCIAEALRINKKKIKDKLSFSEYGVDSIIVINLIKVLNQKFDVNINATELFDYNNVDKLSQLIAQTVDIDSVNLNSISEQNNGIALESNLKIRDQQNHNRKKSRRKSYLNTVNTKSKSKYKSPIAIVGVSGKFGKSNDLEELWHHLSNGDNLVEKVSRWQGLLQDEEKNSGRFEYGSFLENIDCFDPLFFNISGLEATYMDPQQRLFLEESWKALENAGYAGDSIDGMSCGVYVGCSGGDYQQMFGEEAPPQAFWGNMGSVIPARIAYYLNLFGPAVAIDTACSSSLVAIHSACQSLWSEEIEMALAGGVFLQTTPWLYKSAAKAGMLSPTGKCYTFDNRANGFVPGEGIGVVVLKRLNDAIDDGDNIQAVISGIGVNQDGTSNGITAPSAHSQERLECQIYDSFNIDPSDVQMVEAHGTGTPLGDPIEFNALTRAFRKYTSKTNYCALGSIKTNLGHTQMAAGMAGLMKLLLSFQNQQIPPSLNFENANENIELETSPFYVNKSLKKWETKNGTVRRGVLSSFGASGTNAHLVLEEPPLRQLNRVKNASYLIVLSARTLIQLEKQIENLYDYCIDSDAGTIEDISYTLLVGRKNLSHRFAVVARSKKELSIALKSWKANEDKTKVLIGEVLENEFEEQLSLIEDGNSWIEKSKDINNDIEYTEVLQSLGALFVQGYNLNFGDLFRKGSVAKISLPTYPFARDRYWVEPVESREQSQPKNQTNVSTSDYEKAEVTKLFSEELVRSKLEKKPSCDLEVLLCFLNDRENQLYLSELIKEMLPNVTPVFVTSEHDGSNDGSVKQNTFFVDENSDESIKRTLSEIHKIYNNIDAFLYLWPVENVNYSSKYNVIVNVLKGLEYNKLGDVRGLLCGHWESDIDWCFQNSWIAFGRSLNLIQPELSLSTVLVKSDSNSTFQNTATIILDELQNDFLEEVVYLQSERYIQEMSATEMRMNASILQAEGVYIVTGGLGGLGFILAKHLSKVYKARLVLIGRSSFDSRKKTKIEELERIGGEALYIQADVGIEDDLNRCLSIAKSKFGKLNGVIHAAGLGSSKSIYEKSDTDFKNVVHSKIQGTIVLDSILKLEELDFLCYFSSSSAIFGDFGSCDYAVGNRFMMSYAGLHSDSVPNSGCRKVAINWPLWEHGGMQFSDKDMTKIYLESSGQNFISSELGIELFEATLNGDYSNYLPLVGQVEKVSNCLGMTNKKRLCKTIDRKKVLKNIPFSSNGNDTNLETRIQSALQQIISQLLRLPLAELNIKSNLVDFGFDSLTLAEFAKILSEELSLEVTPALFFNYPTIEKIVAYLVKEAPAELYSYFQIRAEENLQEETNTLVGEVESNDVERVVSNKLEDDIAIIGMSGRFPSARNINELWSILEKGENAVSEVPSERFNQLDDSFDTHLVNNFSDYKWMGAIDGVDEFDPLFFEISPADAEAMDPRQRLLLQESWKALEDAGYNEADLELSKIGMFVGVEEGDYQLIAGKNANITSNHSGILASRLGYFLNFKGPVLAINTACSSGLVALHQACKSLKDLECDTAIASGVSLTLTSNSFYGMAAAGMLSKNGKCYTFDERANGMVPGEAIVSIVLKTLSRAKKDNDPIYAVIKGSGVNYDGRTNGITAPNGLAQSQLLHDIYKKHQVDPKNIEYLIAHGTGTKIGDPVEVNALYDTFRKYNVLPNSCALTSTKTNFGHSFAASGLVSLVCLVQAMKNNIIPQSLNYQTPNDYIKWKESPFYVNTKSKDWIAGINNERIGAVSAFGASGTNAHVVVGDYKESVHQTANSKYDSPYLVVLSAKTKEALELQKDNLLTYCKNSKISGALVDVSHTLLNGRSHFKFREAFVVNDVSELLAQLSKDDERSLSEFHFQGSVERDFIMTPTLREEGDSFIKQYLNSSCSNQRKENLLRLAEFYCKGCELNWKELYSLARKLHMPTYPFSTESYWVKDADTNQSVLQKDNQPNNQLFLIKPQWTEAPFVTPKNLSDNSGSKIIVLIEAPDHAAKSIRNKYKDVQCIILKSKKNDVGDKFKFYSTSLFRIVKKIIEKKDRVLLQIVSFDYRNNWFTSGFDGMLRTAQLEFPKLTSQNIQIPSDTSMAKVTEYLSLEANNYSNIRVRYDKGIRHILDWTKIDEFNFSKSIWRENGVYLVTGGLGALGLILTEEIVSHSKNRSVVLCGRSSISKEQELAITRLGKKGCHIEYIRCDIGSRSSVKRMMELIREKHSAIHGIIHAAGINRDNYVLNKEVREFESVLKPKVRGTLFLDEYTKSDKLDFFILFSSGVSIMGNPGQFDYAAANGFLDCFSEDRNEKVKQGARTGKTVSINWPLWSEGGMKMTERDILQMEKLTGLAPIGLKEGLMSFYSALGSPYGQVGVLYGKSFKIEKLMVEATNETLNSNQGKIENEEISVSGDVKILVLAKLKELIARIIKLDLKLFDEEESFEKYGIDSFTITKLNTELAIHFQDLSKTVFFEFRNTQELGRFLYEEHPQESREWVNANNSVDSVVVGSPKNKTLKYELNLDDGFVNEVDIETIKDPIAIIGMSGKYPEAENLDEFWKNLVNGRDCISEVPSERWSLDEFYEEDPTKATLSGKSYSKWGGFLKDISRFEPSFFNMSPREVMNTDPQERLWVETCWKVIEDAGYTRETLREQVDSKVGVFVGVTKTGFELYGPELTRLGKPFYPFTSFSSMANRISYLFDLKGPSLPIDTMCSSSLTAIHEACEHIYRGDCEMAIAGGVNLYLHPSNYIGLCAQKMLSVDGKCKSFGEGGNGFVPGEGVGALLLKPLSKAKQDGDNIYALIKGTSVNHGGKTNGYTVPNPNAQSSLIKSALESAGVKADALSYVEAHGTGTELGDPIEITGLRRAFEKDVSKKKFCSLGSVKSNIGHLEAAAGIASLSKVILQMKNKILVKSLHATITNPNIAFNKSPFKLQRKTKKWKKHVIDGVEHNRMAGISSFGAGGSNAHVIIEEYKNDDLLGNESSSLTKSEVAIVLSAKSHEQLKTKSLELLEVLKSGRFKERDLENIAYTLQVGRENMKVRLAIVVKSLKKLCKKLNQFVVGNQNISNLYYNHPGDDSESIIRKKVSKRKLEKSLVSHDFKCLSKYWVRGESVDWRLLYGASLPIKVSLPTYPFQGKRYWIPDLLEEPLKEPVLPIKDEPQPSLLKSLESDNNIVVKSPTAKPSGISLLKIENIDVHYTELKEDDSTKIKEKREEILPSKGSSQLGIETSVTDNVVPDKLKLDRNGVEEIVIDTLAEALYMDVDEIEIDKTFVEMGLDSIVGVEWIRKINTKFNLSIPATRVYDFPTISQLSTFIFNELCTSNVNGQESESSRVEEKLDVQKADDMEMIPQYGKLKQISNGTKKKHNAHVLLEDIESTLISTIAEALFMEKEEVDIHMNFVDMGMDSIIGVEWIRMLNSSFNVVIPSTRVYDYPTIADFSEFILGLVSENGQEPSADMDDFLRQVQEGSVDIDEAEKILDNLNLDTI